MLQFVYVWCAANVFYLIKIPVRLQIIHDIYL
jgi:hypothetical protein